MSFGSSQTANHGVKSANQVPPAEKLSRIAQQLLAHKVDAYYLPPEDEHLNEYLPENKKRIQWLSGFTGESAPLLVLPDKMHLYVDGRFHLQVDDEVDAAVVNAHKLSKDGPAEETVADTIKEQLTGRTAENPLRLGYDPFIVSPNRLKTLKRYLPEELPIKWVPVTGNLVDPTWSDRPNAAPKSAFAIDESLAGRSVQDKLTSIRAEMKAKKADILPLTKLDDVAWLFNIRGGDIPYNPVLESYAVVTQDQAFLFAPPDKIPADLKAGLEAKGVTVKAYNDYAATLAALVNSNNGSKPGVLVDRGSMTLGTLDILEAGATLIDSDNPVTLQKALKNPTEIDRMKQANAKASFAIMRHLALTDLAFNRGRELNEVILRNDLEKKYKEDKDFYDLSFPTIPGVGSNSAIIHYSHADPEKRPQEGEFYLVDSGCQYTVGGTTDTTRTTVFGEPPADKIARYTAVLKSHIACANYRFLEGTTGAKIDAVAREPLGHEAMDFAHGTGHGVGAFLNVHEGPNRISKVGNVAFQPGMITSIEPGYYEKDWGGIRLENLYYVAEDKEKPPFQGKKWLKFVPLTFVPFERKLIDHTKLTARELAWLKDYNRQIAEKFPLEKFNEDEQAWVKWQLKVPSFRLLYKSFTDFFSAIGPKLH